MILRILFYCLLHVTFKGLLAQTWDIKVSPPIKLAPEECLTGRMTDVQNWVDENGALTKYINHFNAVDLSSSQNVVLRLTEELPRSRPAVLRYLSLAKCSLTRVPNVFRLKDRKNRFLFDIVQYITLYGNNFVDVSEPGEHYGVVMNATDAITITDDLRFTKQGVAVWSAGFQRVTFSQLRELDLRKCSVKIVSDHLFTGMPKLEALYLGENEIHLISTHAFDGLINLQHLDLSMNVAKEDRNFVFESTNVFRNLSRLASLDLSNTKVLQRNVVVLENLSPRLERLSICNTGLRLPSYIFNCTSMRYLDVSGNLGILNTPNVLGGIEGTLQVLFADNIGLRNVEIFYKFKALEILMLKSNELNMIPSRISTSLKNLQILDLDKNRIATWFGSIYSKMSNLRYLSLRDNNINLISADVLDDVKNVSYLTLSGNYPVCNCHARELYEIALTNDNSTQEILQPIGVPSKNLYSFHNGFVDYNRNIAERKRMNKKECGKDCSEIELNQIGKVVLLDYDIQSYQCLVIGEGTTVAFKNVQPCREKRNDVGYDEVEGRWRILLVLLIIPIVLVPLLILLYVFRRILKYFCITVRNSATLSLISKEDVNDETTIYNYDVFVSYCNEDRDWVLDYLLPHLEKDCNVSVCLHERDFQVGLSILENIVSCMDRSRSIMLILSQRFLLSQWCQFEMHLAQHRLLETRREDLILLLLEDIPRKLRPTTLQYLMLTKTYIVWPKVISEQPLFWKRLKKSLISYRLHENISIA